MAGDGMTVEAELEAVGVVVIDVLTREIDRYLNGNCDRIVGEHEALESFVAFLVAWRGRDCQCCKTRCVILFPSDRWV